MASSLCERDTDSFVVAGPYVSEERSPSIGGSVQSDVSSGWSGTRFDQRD